MKFKLLILIFSVISFNYSVAGPGGTGGGVFPTESSAVNQFNDFNQNWTKDGFRVGDVVQENGFTYDKIVISDKFITDNKIDLVEFDSSKALADEIIWDAMGQTSKIKAYDKLDVIKESINNNTQMLIFVDELENKNIELKFFK